MSPSIDSKTGPSVYSLDQITAWLHHIRLPTSYTGYISNLSSFPKTYECLRTLMRCQISRFWYENLSVHYSPTHQVDIRPEVVYEKFMGPNRDGGNGRGGYCMELSILFHHLLRGLGFQVYLTGVRNRARIDGVPGGEYQGFTHINNIVHLPDGKKFSIDVGFGGDGPTTPLPLDEEAPGRIFQNLGAQQIRLVHDNIPKQDLPSPKLWIYQYRNGPEKEWNSFYSFAEMEFFQDDFEIMNLWTSSRPPSTRTVLVVRFLREGENVLFSPNPDLPLDKDVEIVGKVMLVDNVVKANLGGRTSVVHSFSTEEGRLQALRDYVGIFLSDEEAGCIKGSAMALS